MARRWRMARSLEVLRGALNRAFPRRSTSSDGGIGDAAHSARSSDHNPDDTQPVGIVRARDFTHDPGDGLDCERLYQTLVRHRDPRVKYIIWRGTITSGARGPRSWVRRPYSGPNPHNHHLHLSVVPGPAGDGDVAWNLDGLVGSAPAPSGQTPNVYRKGDKGEGVKSLQRTMRAWYPNDLSYLVVDGDYGDQTVRAVRWVQGRLRLFVDGVAGPATRRALGLIK